VLNSADSHWQEPANLWLARLPASLRDRAPRFEYTETHRIWIADGKPTATEPLNERIRGQSDQSVEAIEDRLRDLDLDGIWAEAIFGTLGLFCLRFKDPQFASACCRAYNDCVREVFAPYKQRLLPIALIPVLDIDAAVKEIERIAALGLRGIAMPMMPMVPYFHERYDPVWSAAQSNGLPISFHFDTGIDLNGPDAMRAFGGAPGSAAFMPPRAAAAMRTSIPNLMTWVAQHCIATLVGAGVLATHPSLQIVCVEANAGWLAPLMEAMDYAWADTPNEPPGREWQSLPGFEPRWCHALKPSDYVRQQVKVAFQDEPAPLKFLHVTGSEPLLWSSDFPHPEGTWPDSQAITARLFASVDPGTRDAVLGGNLAKLYNIAPPEPQSDCFPKARESGVQ
jgi:predicted TIM-barrel fold metal-dependent hydrolase